VIVMLVAVAVGGTSLASASRGTTSGVGVAETASADSCASLVGLSLPGTTINSAVDTPAGSVPPPFPGPPPLAVPETCRVHATVTSPGVNDHIGIDVWIPVSGWNGRFEGVGGGGYSTGSPGSLAGPVSRRLLSSVD